MSRKSRKSTWQVRTVREEMNQDHRDRFAAFGISVKPPTFDGQSSNLKKSSDALVRSLEVEAKKSNKDLAQRLVSKWNGHPVEEFMLKKTRTSYQRLQGENAIKISLTCKSVTASTTTCEDKVIQQVLKLATGKLVIASVSGSRLARNNVHQSNPY